MAECAASGLGGCLLSVYFSLLAFGIVTLIAEQKQIHCSKPRQILYLLMFPVFIFTYIPMAVVARCARMSPGSIFPTPSSAPLTRSARRSKFIRLFGAPAAVTKTAAGVS